jgi:hypothetical protein
MPQASAAAPNFANYGGHKTVSDFADLVSGLPLHQAVTAVLQFKEPRKTWAFLASLVSRPNDEMSESVAKHRISGRRDYSAEDLQRLLRSEEGIDFLVAIMGDATPTWWRWIMKVMTLAAVRRRQAEDAQEILKLETSGDADVGARRRIKGALNAEKRISSAVARAETSLGLSRPNLDRVGTSAGSRSGGLPGRAVARG